MNQFFNAQKRKHQMTHLPWGDLVFPLLLSASIKSLEVGSENEWVTCVTVMSDDVTGANGKDCSSTGDTRLANTFSSSTRAMRSFPTARKTALEKDPGGTGQQLETLAVLLHIIASISLPWWQLPKMFSYKAPRGDFCVSFLDKALDLLLIYWFTQWIFIE